MRPYIFDEQDLAPSVVTDDDVRNITVTIEPLADLRDRQTIGNATLQLVQIVVRVGMARQRTIFDLTNAGNFSSARLGDETYIVPAPRQMPRNVNVLARKILMNEKKSHR